MAAALAGAVGALHGAELVVAAVLAAEHAPDAAVDHAAELLGEVHAGAGLEDQDEQEEGDADGDHGDGEAPVVGRDVELGDAEDGGDKGQGQEDHGDARQDLDVGPLLDGAPRLHDAAAAEELLPQRADLGPRVLVLVPHGLQLADRALELVPQALPARGVGESAQRVGLRVRPQRLVPAGPEIRAEGIGVGLAHRLDAVVDHAQGVVGPEIPAGEGEVFVLEEELVAELDIKHELVLYVYKYIYIVSAVLLFCTGMGWYLGEKHRNRTGVELTGGVMSFVIISFSWVYLFTASRYSAAKLSRKA